MKQLLRFLLSLPLLASAYPALAQHKITSAQWQFIDAVRRNDIAKARDLRELGNIDPNDFEGRPFVTWLFEVGGQLNAMSDEAFSYTFDELKQPFNAPYSSNGNVRIFALFCTNMDADRNSDAIAGLERTRRRIQFALGHGADVNAVPDVAWGLRDDQPLPQCVASYLKFRNNPQAKAIALTIVDTLLKHGADPQYNFPISTAAETYDVDLFRVLHANGARIDHVFPVTSEIDTCRQKNVAPNTIMAKLPMPKDADAPQARAFLQEVIAAGANISEPQNYYEFRAGSCEHQHVSLFDRAVSAGQTTYAKMVRELAAVPAADASPEKPSTAPAPAAAIGLPTNSPQPPSIKAKRKVLASCPGLIDAVDVEQDPGKYNPPALLAPSRDNGQTGANLRAEWNDLAGQKIGIRCHSPGAPTGEVVNLLLPAAVTSCVRKGNRFTCFGKPDSAPPTTSTAIPSRPQAASTPPAPVQKSADDAKRLRSGRCLQLAVRCDSACDQRAAGSFYQPIECHNGCNHFLPHCTETGEFFNSFTGERIRVD